MKLIAQGFTVLLWLLVSASWARPSSEDNDATTTPESIDNIFRKYDQEYPFHGGAVAGNNNEAEANVQNDAPVMEAIIARLNEIMNDDKPNEFVAPNADGSEKQRSLLRKQNDELVFGPHRINRRVKESANRENEKNAGLLDLDQNVFLNKDLLADSYFNRPIDRATTTRRTVITTRPTVSRIPVRITTATTRFPTRRPTVMMTARTTAAPVNYEIAAAGEKISELIAEELLTKPEGNKLSIPVLSVATPDFEEDLPDEPSSVVAKPNKVTAQTDDFEDASHNQYKNYRSQMSQFRKRRESGSYGWLPSWLNFYGESSTEVEQEQGRQMSALSKRQTANEEQTVAAEPVPIPEEVKSIDVPPQVSDSVMKTILDIDDPQTRNEFAKDVPAIEEKLEQLEEEQQKQEDDAKQQSTIEVAIVELGGRVIEPQTLATAINESRQVVVESISKAIDKLAEDAKLEELGKSLDLSVVTEVETVPEVPEMKVLRDQIPDDFARSGNPPPAKIVDIITAIPSEMVSVMTTSETIRDESGRSVSSSVAVNHLVTEVTEGGQSTFIEVNRVVPKKIVGDSTVKIQANESVVLERAMENVTVAGDDTVRSISSPPEATMISIANTKTIEGEIFSRKVNVETEAIAEGGKLSEVVQTADSEDQLKPELVKPRADDMEMVIEDRRPEFENPAMGVAVEDAKKSSPQIKTPAAIEGDQDFEIVLEPEPEDEPTPKSLQHNNLPIRTPEPEVITTTEIVPPTTIAPTEVKVHVVEETVLITDSATLPESTKSLDDPSVPLISENVDSRLNSMIITEVLEDENMEIGFNSVGQTTVLPLEWLKDDLPGVSKLVPGSGSESSSISTTESTSDVELGTTPYGSSEEVDSKEDDAEKIRRKVEKRRRKEEEKRLKKEKEERKKAAGKINSSEEKLAKLIEPETDEKLTKEEMVMIFSSPETDIDLRRLNEDKPNVDPALVISEVVETQKNISSDHHVVIKKDGVAIKDDDDESAESAEVTTIAPDVVQILEEALDKEMEQVEKVLDLLDNAIEESIKENDSAKDPEAADVAEQMSSVVSSKNTRHLVKVGYSDYVEKDISPDVIESRLVNDLPQSAASETPNSRAFVLVGSGLFLITGFVLFALVVLLVKRSRRYGSLDLTMAA